MKKLIPHTNIDSEHQSLVGNKALRLAQLAREGIATAPFCVIPNSIKEMSPAIAKQISEKLYSNPSTFYAVRSSANCEDGITASFAGQFESYLSLKAKEVIPAIKQCWSSARRDTVVSYCHYHKLDPNRIKMAVMVQQMIKADKGGVIFTHDVFSDRNAIIIEATEGLGEQVVSGSVDSQKYVLDKTTSDPLECILGFAPSVLSTKELDQLFETALKIEKLYNKPQDIEWAIQNNKLYILQTRPLT